MVCAGILLAVAARAVPAGAADQDAAFVQSLVDAINSKSLDRRKALLAPLSRVCASGDSEPFYNWTVTRQARRPIPAGYKWKISAIPPDQPLMFADRFDYPVRPSHLLQLDFETGQNSATTMLVMLVRDAGQWREVVACPKPETIAAARVAEQQRAKHEDRVRALAASAPADLKDAVVKLIKEGRRVEAFKRYSEVTGEDLATSKDVVELLAR